MESLLPEMVFDQLKHDAAVRFGDLVLPHANDAVLAKAAAKIDDIRLICTFVWTAYVQNPKLSCEDAIASALDDFAGRLYWVQFAKKRFIRQVAVWAWATLCNE